MPFRSRKQMRYLFATQPTIAKRWAAEARRKHKPMVQSKRSKR